MRDEQNINPNYMGTMFKVEIFKDGNFGISNKEDIMFSVYAPKREDGYMWQSLQLNDYTREKEIKELCFKIRKLFLELEKELEEIRSKSNA